MAPEADPIQFPRQIWQTVSGQARQVLVEKEYCAEQSRVENLRCIHFEDETDSKYGDQLWYFEAIGIDPIGRRHMLYGALDFSVQYGLLIPSQTALFEDAELRQRFVTTDFNTTNQIGWINPTARTWIVRTMCIGMVMTAMLWLTVFVSYSLQGLITFK
ncbi:MAG: hypothetical protein SGI77_04120 [Pirellulaceae bacterium]|nr:hypothetical protein [Pirellulaceae bacterium]